jgi:molybdenum cofactor cytidylyltransferase
VIAGIILAAGQSSRLGRPKQLLPLAGEPLIRHTLRRVLASSLDEVILVVGHEAAAVRAAVADLPVRIVENPAADQGQSTSVLAGLAALTLATEAVIILLGDQPGVAPDVIDALIATWRDTAAPVVAPRYRDVLGNPVLFARRVFPELATLQGDTGARSVVRAHEAAGLMAVVPVPSSAPRDVDTEADYAELATSFDHLAGKERWLGKVAGSTERVDKRRFMMSESAKQPMGTMVGFDLTVPAAETVRDFYAKVIGWIPEALDMGGYSDYFMKSADTGQIVAGVVHARGVNADLPAQWLTYIAVPDLEESMRRCLEGGGTLVTGIKGSEGGRYCVIQDPAGAVLALMQLGES